MQNILEPAVISSDNSPSTKFQARFDYIGTRDYTSWCAMGAALDFRDMLGAVRGRAVQSDCFATLKLLDGLTNQVEQSNSYQEPLYH